MAARKITGMHKREGTSNWALRVMIPTALRQGFYDGRSFVRVSLNTPDETMARTAALGIHRTYAETFARQQAQLKPMPQVVISPALADLLAARARARILAAEDNFRFDTEALGPFLTLFAQPPTSRFSLEVLESPTVVVPRTGMAPEHLQALSRVHEALRLELSSSLAMGQLKAGEEAAAYEARELGLSADWSRNRPAVLTVLRAVVGAWIDVGRRNLGDAVDTPRMPEMPEGLVIANAAPAAPTAPGKSKGALRTLWDVRDEWAAEGTAGKGKSSDSQRKTERALNMLEASGSMKPLELLTRQDAIDFRAYVKANMAGRTDKTQSDLMANVQTLLNFAVEQRGYLLTNPWAGTAIAKGKATNKRQPWSNEDLAVLVSSPIWTRYEMPEYERAGREAAYWVPLIALYGGLRLTEVCQLRLRDVVERDGVLVMDVNEVDGNSVKSAAGIRIVPVHSKLLALGFTDYLADIRRRADAEGSGAAGLVFPDLRVVDTRSGAINFSDGFRFIARSMSIYRRWRDFHSLRTTASTCLRGVHPGLGESLILAVMGHEGANIGQTNYTVHGPKALQRVIEHLEFPALSALPRVYPQRAA